MSATLDHPMHWVPDLKAATADYRDAGLALHHTPFAPAPGTRSSTWWDGRGYIEVLSLQDRAAALSPSAYGGLPAAMMGGVDAALAAGWGAANTVVVVEDIAAATAAMRTAGIDADTASVTLGRRPRSITLSFAWPTRGPRWSPILLHYSLPRWLRTGAERLKRGRPPALTLDSVVIETPDPDTSRTWLAAVLGPDAHPDEADVGLGQHHLDLIAGPAETVTTVRLRGPDAPRATIAGLQLEPATGTS